jgi:hypothetical protein
MNADGRRGVALDFRQRARETAKQAASAKDRKFWLALAANWEKIAKEEEAPKIRPWST